MISEHRRDKFLNKVAGLVTLSTYETSELLDAQLKDMLQDTNERRELLSLIRQMCYKNGDELYALISRSTDKIGIIEERE